ncbi:MAG: CocE/NonD family hydrolase C-terminal non-catalytic domain-containing protein, partial [Candidatus Limnocylindria bacterium]
RWLKGIENGIEREPILRTWMQETPPTPTQTERPGRWLVEPSWPTPNVRSQVHALNAGGTLERERGPELRLEQRGPLASGHDGGIWCPHGAPGDLPGDQRAADGMSLTFTSAPLAERIEILGHPEVRLSLAVDRPQALVAVRLCDIAPDGASTLISYGLLNLTHRESHEHPTPLEPGRRYDNVIVRLNVIGYAVPPSHRLRVAVAPNYWPWAWPSPAAVTLSVFSGTSELRLPVRPVRTDEPVPPAFDEPESLEQAQPEVVRTGGRTFTVTQDRLSGLVEERRDRTMGAIRMPSRGLLIEGNDLDVYTVVEGQPLSACCRAERTTQFSRPGWRIRVETVSTLSADAEDFHLTNTVDAYENGVRVFTKSWDRAIPRENV